jgi:hypothetical protein
MQRIESRLTFVINYKANSDKETSQFLQSINKSKSDIDALIVCDDNTKSAIEKSQSELLQKARLFFVNDLSNLTNLCQGSILVWVDDILKLNLNAILGWYNSNKKSIANDTVYMASRLADTKVKAPWQLKMYNHFYRFFTPSLVSDNEFGIMLVKTDYFETLVQNACLTDNSYQNNLLQLQLSEINIQEFAISAAEKSSIPSIVNIITTPINWFTYVLNWFILSPNKSFKT